MSIETLVLEYVQKLLYSQKPKSRNSQMSITKRVDKMMGLPGWHSGKEFTRNAGDSGDVGSIPGPGRSLGEGNGNLLQYSCLGNPMDREAWRLQSMGSQRVGHDWATNISTSTYENYIKFLGPSQKTRSKYWMYFSIYETITACKTGFQEQPSASSMPNSNPVHCALSGDGGILLHP